MQFISLASTILLSVAVNAFATKGSAEQVASISMLPQNIRTCENASILVVPEISINPIECKAIRKRDDCKAFFGTAYYFNSKTEQCEKFNYCDEQCKPFATKEACENGCLTA